MRQYELVERVQRYKPDVNEALLNKAYVYAMQKHGMQKRASGDPYFAHPLEVAAILTDLKLDDASIAVALLHDTIEDTDATRAEIDQMFGAEIGTLVDGLTKIERLQLVTREEAQAENLRKLLLAISADVRVLLVKLADRLHNMRTLDFMPADKRKRIATETMDIYAPLAGRMGMQAVRDELEDIAFKVLNPDANKITRATIAQRDEQFFPHVVAVSVGSSVEFPNEDTIFHNVFSLSRPATFDLGRYPSGTSRGQTFQKPGIVKVYCQIHSHMSAVVRVFDHGWFTIPGDNGTFALDGVPPGSYTLVAWHERIGERRDRITIRAGATTEITFTLPVLEPTP